MSKKAKTRFKAATQLDSLTNHDWSHPDEYEYAQAIYCWSCTRGFRPTIDRDGNDHRPAKEGKHTIHVANGKALEDIICSLCTRKIKTGTKCSAVTFATTHWHKDNLHPMGKLIDTDAIPQKETPEIDPKDYPVVQAFVSKCKKQSHVWCPFCQDWHGHGPNDGHRTAHCINPQSPFKETGYRLRVVGEMTEKLRKSIRRRQPYYWYKRT